MKKNINVDDTSVGMRIDRFLRKYFNSVPQSLIERSLRSGKIKLNKKKIKSSVKLQNNDLIELHNLQIKKEISQTSEIDAKYIINNMFFLLNFYFSVFNKIFYVLKIYY